MRGGGLVCLMPSGPHGVGYFSRAVSARLGSIFHAIDLDPRWVKKLTARGAAGEVAAYVDHVLEQAAVHPADPARRQSAHDASAVRGDRAQRPSASSWSTRRSATCCSAARTSTWIRYELLHEIFPETTITMAFGSTMILSQAITRAPDRMPSCSTPGRRMSSSGWSILIPASRSPYGARGQVMMNHISKGMFIPNNLERDSAIRLRGHEGQIGDSVSDIAPVATFEGEAVIEGVY